MGMEHFDLVEGGIANDKVFNTIDLYFAGTISKDDALGKLSFEYPNHQLCILNQKIIVHHLHFIKATEVTKAEEMKYVKQITESVLPLSGHTLRMAIRQDAGVSSDNYIIRRCPGK